MVLDKNEQGNVEALLKELDELLLHQARDGKVTAAVALYRHVQARLKMAAGEGVKEAGLDARPIKEIVAELEVEVAKLKKRME